MHAVAPITRFAPSPTGELHLGNARTALFNFLLAQHSAGGRFLLRIEDTDTERSREQHVTQLLKDLNWLGIRWHDEPVRQSQRSAIYAGYFTALLDRDAVYPCYCSAEQLELSRRAQLASGRAPRYAGTCSALSAAQRNAREASGAAAALRFRVPAGRRIEFNDLVHGAQSFLSDDIGDFVIRRADGSAAFFFSNAVDDALMGITQVLRGDDHLANTPRQLLVLQACGLREPQYGHVALLTGDDGAPLSKRNGALSLRELREAGYLPTAVCNLLFRLGHSSSETGLLDAEAMARAFDCAHLGRSPSRFDRQQLDVWQKQAAHQLDAAAASAWLRDDLVHYIEPDRLDEFSATILPNIVLPRDARLWADVIRARPPALSAESRAVLDAAPVELFAAAAAALRDPAQDWHGLVEAVRTATGLRGKALFRPLRIALTGLDHGPELASLLPLMAREAIAGRIDRYTRRDYQ
ncbi:MAG: glutamate--tRNA ligase [Steroidobacteraceae bacterium]